MEVHLSMVPIFSYSPTLIFRFAEVSMKGTPHASASRWPSSKDTCLRPTPHQHQTLITLTWARQSHFQAVDHHQSTGVSAYYIL